MAGNWQTWRRLVPALGASLIVHALLITGFGSPPPGQPALAQRLSWSVSLRAAALPARPGRTGPKLAIPAPQPASAPPPRQSAPYKGPATSAPSPAIQPSLPGWIADLPTQVDLNYYPATALSLVAIPTTEIQTLLPESELGKVAGQHLTLRLRLLINEHGVVDDVELVENDAPDALQDRALINTTADAFRRMRFQPAVRDNLPVRSRKEIEVCLGMCEPDTDGRNGKAGATIQVTAQEPDAAALPATAPRPFAERARRDK